MLWPEGDRNSINWGEFTMDLVRKSYEVHSEQYDVKGTMSDFGRVAMLKFTYEDKEKEITIKRPSITTTDKEMIALACKEMDTYIGKVMSGEIRERKLMFHYWYIDKIEKPNSELSFVYGHGYVTGHAKIHDSEFINTSVIQNVEVDEFEGMVIIHTKNSAYYCPIEYCDFEKQDKFPQLIPDYEMLRRQYYKKMPDPKIEAGKVLLIVSNFDPYFFNGMYYLPDGAKKRARYTADIKQGTFQDSFLIDAQDYGIDLGYYLHYQSIELFSEQTGGRPFFVENIGDVKLYVKAACGTIALNPGERKEIKRENAEKEATNRLSGNMIPKELIY